MEKCDICGEEINGGAVFTCNYCKGTFCPDHRLPFNHNCSGMEEWRKSGQKKHIQVEKADKATTNKEIPIQAAVIVGLIIILLIGIIYSLTL